MTREDVLNNIRVNYRQFGVDTDEIETMIRSGEAEGFSYQTIYTGIRMALSSIFDTKEYFTPAEVAEALGVTENEIIEEIENMRDSIAASGGDPDEYARKVDPQDKMSFILPAEFLH